MEHLSMGIPNERKPSSWIQRPVSPEAPFCGVQCTDMDRLPCFLIENRLVVACMLPKLFLGGRLWALSLSRTHPFRADIRVPSFHIYEPTSSRLTLLPSAYTRFYLRGSSFATSRANRFVEGLERWVIAAIIQRGSDQLHRHARWSSLFSP
jgi:hypothetical protein